jgi:hypothetical protein
VQRAADEQLQKTRFADRGNGGAKSPAFEILAKIQSLLETDPIT